MRMRVLWKALVESFFHSSMQQNDRQSSGEDERATKNDLSLAGRSNTMYETQAYSRTSLKWQVFKEKLPRGHWKLRWRTGNVEDKR